jgi:hypothetical protein
VDRGQDQVEALISASTDGSVLEWDLRKGLSVSTLMQLRRGGMVGRSRLVYLID